MRRLVLDSQLLVLLAVGVAHPHRLAAHKKTSNFESGDFELLRNVLANFDDIVICPNVATEASNHLDPARPSDQESSAALAAIVTTFQEEYSPSARCVERQEYAWLGLTDAVLITLAEAGASLLTRDTQLYAAAAALGLHAFHFDHLRAGAYGEFRAP